MFGGRRMVVINATSSDEILRSALRPRYGARPIQTCHSRMTDQPRMDNSHTSEDVESLVSDYTSWCTSHWKEKRTRPIMRGQAHTNENNARSHLSRCAKTLGWLTKLYGNSGAPIGVTCPGYTEKQNELQASGAKRGRWLPHAGCTLWSTSI